MKNILKYGFTACLAAAFVFSGCSKDDDNDDNNSNNSEESSTSIVGTWKLTTDEIWVDNKLQSEFIDGVNYACETGERAIDRYEEEELELSADGKFVDTYYYGEKQAKENKEVTKGTYTVDGNKLIITRESGKTSEGTFKITGKTLVIETEIWYDTRSGVEYYVETPDCDYIYMKATYERQ